MSHEPQVECAEDQNDSNVRDQPFPESIPEETDVHTDDNGYHRRDIESQGKLPIHANALAFVSNSRNGLPILSVASMTLSDLFLSAPRSIGT